MTGSTIHSLGTLLCLLLGAMLAVVIAALAVPTWSAIEQRDSAVRVAALAHAGQAVFAALQYLRMERGTVRVAGQAANPVIAAVTESTAPLIARSTPALDSVLRDCAALRCIADDPSLARCMAASTGWWRRGGTRRRPPHRQPPRTRSR